MIKSIFQNKVISNAGWLITAKVIQMVINLVVSILTTRFLGPSNFGLLNYGTAYTSFFIPLCTLGINSILVKEFVAHKYDEGTIIGSALVMRAVSSILSVIMIFSAVSLIDTNEPTTILVTVICSIGLIFNIFEVLNYWFQSRLQSKITAIIMLLAYVFMAGYKIILLILKKSIVWFALATSVDYICVAVLLLIFYKKHKGSKLKFSSSCSHYLLKTSYHFILPSMMVAIYGYVDKFMLKQIISDAEIGYYSTAVTVCSMWSFVLTAIIDSVYPTIMEAFKGDRKQFEKRNKQLYAIVFYLSILMSATIVILGKYIVLILYGKDYLPAVGPLRIITWYTAFSYLGVARNAWIVCEDKQKYLKYIYISAAISNVLMNLLLIPLWGAVGAALASLVTQIFTILFVPFFIKELRQNNILLLEAIALRDVLPKKENHNGSVYKQNLAYHRWHRVLR